MPSQNRQNLKPTLQLQIAVTFNNMLEYKCWRLLVVSVANVFFEKTSSDGPAVRIIPAVGALLWIRARRSLFKTALVALLGNIIEPIHLSYIPPASNITSTILRARARVQKIPTKRQTLLFSATYPDEIASIANRVMQNPTMVEAPAVHEESTIKQYFHKANSADDRMTALRLLLAKHKPTSALVFCNTKSDTQDVADELVYYGFYALAIHGDLDQRERDQALIRFSNKSVSVLVATDVAARGLDIDALDMVINFNIAHDPEVHVHRIGRTGRAGRSGIACTLYGEREIHKLDALELGIDVEQFADPLPSDSYLDKPVKKPAMTTLKIDGAKKQKLRPGDIVGGLTGKGGIPGDKIGKINVASNWSYVAVSSELIKPALKKISNDKLKGRSFRVRILS